jgi:hypothetical protein
MSHRQPDHLRRLPRAANAARRSRLAALAACVLSLLVHGTSLAVLSAVSREPAIAAPLGGAPATFIAVELISVSITAEGIPDDLPVTAPQGPPVQARFSPARRRPIAREPPLLLPEPEHRRAEVEPAPLEPPPVVTAAATAPTPTLDPSMGPLVPSETARALRLYDSFPNIVVRAGYARADVEVRICVSEVGAVREAWIGPPSDLFSETLRAAILRWRYRPFTVNGHPTPFCHLIRISYRAG